MVFGVSMGGMHLLGASIPGIEEGQPVDISTRWRLGWSHKWELFRAVYVTLFALKRLVAFCYYSPSPYLGASFFFSLFQCN